MDGMSHASLMTAFIAGLLSFVSPCVLPLVPSYLGYVTGLSFSQLTDFEEQRRLRKPILVNSLLFIVGFSTIFIAFGASASLLGQILSDYQGFIRKAGAILMITFGLFLLGILKPVLLMREKRLHFSSRPAGYFGAFLIGAAFAAGWTPCVGPVLATMLMYASTTDTLLDGVTLLAFYSFGLGLPLLLASLSLNRFLGSRKAIRRHLETVSVVSGVLLIGFGLVLYTNSFALLTAFLAQHRIGW